MEETVTYLLPLRAHCCIRKRRGQRMRANINLIQACCQLTVFLAHQGHLGASLGNLLRFAPARRADTQPGSEDSSAATDSRADHRSDAIADGIVIAILREGRNIRCRIRASKKPRRDVVILNAGLDGIECIIQVRTIAQVQGLGYIDRKSTRLNSSHVASSYAV